MFFFTSSVTPASGLALRGKQTYPLMKNLFFLLVLALSLFSISSCGGDDDDNGGGNNPDLCLFATFNEQVLASVNALQAAALNFGNDPTTANCEAYRTAAQDYLDTIRSFDTCADIISTQSYQESLAEAEMEVANLQC